MVIWMGIRYDQMGSLHFQQHIQSSPQHPPPTLMEYMTSDTVTKQPVRWRVSKFQHVIIFCWWFRRTGSNQRSDIPFPMPMIIPHWCYFSPSKLKNVLFLSFLVHELLHKTEGCFCIVKMELLVTCIYNNNLFFSFHILTVTHILSFLHACLQTGLCLNSLFLHTKPTPKGRNARKLHISLCGP